MNKQYTTTAHLRKDVRTSGRDSYIAVVDYKGTLTERELCDEVANESDGAFKSNDLQAATKLVVDKMIEKALNGYLVDMGPFCVKLKIRGLFNGENDRFDSTRHGSTLKLKPKHSLLKELGNVNVDVTGHGVNGCSIGWIENTRTGSIDGELVIGDILRIIGHGLKVDGESKSVGVYFVQVNDGKEIKLKENDIIANHESELQVRVPDDLEWKSHFVKIVTQYDSELRRTGDVMFMARNGAPLRVADVVWGD